MKSLIFFLLSLLFHTFATADNLIHDRRVQQQRDCFEHTFGDYESWRNWSKAQFAKTAKTPEQLNKAINWFDQRYSKQQFDLFKSDLSCRTFQYPVDGHLVSGFVIKPKTSEKDLPVLVYNRGGNGDFGKVVFSSMMRNLFPVAHEGFIIIGSQYRGTLNETSEIQDEFGGEDVKDVTALFGYIANIKGSDPQRLGMFGASRGGMQTFLTLKQTPYVKAVATIASPSDLEAMLDKRPRMENVYKRRIPNYAVNKVAELEKRSVIKWVDQLPQVPILLIHGTNDKRVSVEQSIALAEALDNAQDASQAGAYILMTIIRWRKIAIRQIGN